MCSKFISKVLSYENGRVKLLPFSRERYLCAPVKSYTFRRSAATVTSAVGFKDGAVSAESRGLVIPPGKQFFLKYFLNHEEYRSLVLDPCNLNFETEGRPESVHILKNLTVTSENEELIGKLKSSLLKEKEILHVEEICNSLFWTYEHKENNLAKEIANLLETELLNRKLSKPEMIKVLLTFNETWGRVNRRSVLQFKLKNKIYFGINSLTPKQFIAAFYCNSKFNKEMIKLIKFNVINYASSIIPSLDSVELGVIARGLLVGNFYSSNFKLKQNFLKRAVELSGTIDKFSLVAICKFLKENVTYMEAPHLLEFQENLIPHLSKYTYVNLNCLIAVGVRLGCLNSTLSEKVVNIFKENINDCNLDEILSLITTLTYCDVADEELLKLAIEKFERAVEDGTIDHSNNRKNLVLFLNNLIHHRVYPKKLLDVTFAEGLTFFKQDVKYGNYIKAKYWETKCFLDIDKPEFNYNSFSEKEERKLFKLCKYVLFSMKETSRLYDNLYALVNTMREILVESYGGDEKVYMSFWHMAYPKALFLRFDQNLNAQPIPANFKSLNCYPIKALKDDHIWVCVSVRPVVHCFGTEKVNLTALTQIRHLEAFGFKPILVHYSTFKNHIQQNTANEYLNNLINEHLHKTS